MLRRVVVLGLVVTLVSTLAAVAALQTSTEDAEAQVSAYPMDYLCLDYYTGLYKGSFNTTCPGHHQLLVLPDAYPLTLCASAYDSFFRKPLSNGECRPPTKVRIDLPSLTPVKVCYVYATGRIKAPTPYPNGSCGSGITGGILVSLPQDLIVNPDSYQTLANVDIDVPAADGVLSNDGGQGIEVISFDASSANGGTVNVNPDGSFTYTPPAPDPAPFVGTDTFTYTVEEDRDGLTEVVTVTIEVREPVVWFVDVDAADPGDGRRLTPFNDISVLDDDGNDPDSPGDFIFLYEASATYNTAFDLEENQYLVGQEVDLEKILLQAIEGTTLSGLDATEVPPFIVTPDADPSGDMPVLRFPDTALTMANGSTAVGLTIVSDNSIAVSLFSALDTTLDRVKVYGGTDGDGADGIDLANDSGLTIVDSEIYGGDGEELSFGSSSGTSLQGGSNGGNGGDGIQLSNSLLLVSRSVVSAGDGESGTGIVGRGGSGILFEGFATITVEDNAAVYGGNGGDGGFSGNDGGDGIGSSEFSAPIVASETRLQGGTGPFIPSITVTGASVVEGGDGGGGNENGGFGGAGILAPNMVVSLTDGSRATGANGGDSSGYAGDAGEGIVIGGMIDTDDLTTGSSLQGSGGSEFTLLDVDGSTVEGGVGGEGDDFGGWGGDGIVFAPFFLSPTSGSSLQGPGISGTLVLEITSSDVTAGHGGSSSDVGGDGGWGVVILGSPDCCGGPPIPNLPDYDIDINVTGSSIVGGDGAAGDTDGGYGGVGIANGIPGFFFLLSDREDQRFSELQGPGSLFAGGHLVVVDSNVDGGAGGTAVVEYGGDGGPGILSAGFESSEPFTSSSLQGLTSSAASVWISNTTVTGGPSGSGNASSYGGDGIVATGIDLTVNQGSSISGGIGADSTESASDGGFGIYIEHSVALVDASTVTAAAGGNSLAPTGNNDGGYGSEGISLYEADLTVQNGSQVFGGDGGDSAANPREGGDGILADASTVTITDSSATGGNGGEGFIDSSQDGGHGVHVAACLFCNTLTATNAMITGGNGGDGYDGGDGGEGVVIEDDNAIISQSVITGGNAGIGTTGEGHGAPAITGEFVDGNDYYVDIQTSTLIATTGDEGLEPSLPVRNSGSGSVCLNIAGNTPTGDFIFFNADGGVLGITQEDDAALSTANNGVGVSTSGPITYNCTIPVS